MGSTQKYIAEAFGTAVLVFIGCGSVALTGFGEHLATMPIGIVGIAIAFGIAVTAMAYTIGPVSGCHINPSVTAAVWASGRMGTSEAIGYIISQIIGGLIGALLLYLILKGKVAGYDVATQGLGQNGWQAFGVGSAIAAEFIGTLIFTLVILAVTGAKGSPSMAGLVIGLTLLIIHIVFIPVTGTSVNAARSIGPAVFVGGVALSQLWLFIVVPTIAGAIAGWLVRSKTLDI